MVSKLNLVNFDRDANGSITVQIDGESSVEIPVLTSDVLTVNSSGTHTGAVTGAVSGQVTVGATVPIKMDYTDNSGTPGNTTISKPRGRFAMAAGASAVTVTNTLCAATSTVLLSKASNDATATDFKVVPGAGSFVVTAAAAATGNVVLDFVLIKDD